MGLGDIIKLLLVLSCVACSEQTKHGKFLEEPFFESYVENYVYTVDEARDLLNLQIKKHNYYYKPFPKEIVYAFDGGYFFIKGEFKVNLQMDGYYVNKKGEVSPLNLKWSISREAYKSRILKKQ